jgi:Mediator complex subunit MED14
VTAVGAGGEANTVAQSPTLSPVAVGMPGRVIPASSMSSASGANGAATTPTTIAATTSGEGNEIANGVVNGSSSGASAGGMIDGPTAPTAPSIAPSVSENKSDLTKMSIGGATVQSIGDDGHSGAVVNGGGNGGAIQIKTEPGLSNGQVMKMGGASTGPLTGPEQLLANGVSAPSSSSNVNPSGSSSFKELPPEIQHITEGFVSMGKLIERVVQLTWNDLTELIEKLADMPIDTQSNSSLANGVSTEHGRLGSESAISLQKRLMWLDFAKRHRDRFIKLAVVSQWSKNVEDVRMFIDLMCWSNERFTAMEDIARSLGQLKLDLHPFKMSSPDIKTALEVLSTGKASWMPDVSYTTPLAEAFKD